MYFCLEKNLSNFSSFCFALLFLSYELLISLIVFYCLMFINISPKIMLKEFFFFCVSSHVSSCAVYVQLRTDRKRIRYKLFVVYLNMYFICVNCFKVLE